MTNDVFPKQITLKKKKKQPALTKFLMTCFCCWFFFFLSGDSKPVKPNQSTEMAYLRSNPFDKDQS